MNSLKDHINGCFHHEMVTALTGVETKTASDKCPEVKPHGRLAWNLHLLYGCKIDISVMPKKES